MEYHNSDNTTSKNKLEPFNISVKTGSLAFWLSILDIGVKTVLFLILCNFKNGLRNEILPDSCTVNLLQGKLSI
jgi:hypothetical protein